MKLKSYLYLVIAAFAWVSCSDDDTQPENNNPNNPENTNVLIKSEIYTPSPNCGDCQNYNLSFNYDEQGRWDKFTYEDLFIHWESEDNFPGTDKPLNFMKIYLDNSGKVTQEIKQVAYSGQGGYSGIAYRNTYTYDTQGRITEIFAEEQNINGSGNPTNSFMGSYRHNLTWDAGNNLTSRRSESILGNNGGNYQKWTYSGFETGPQNTLRTNNYGFKFYGNFGYDNIHLYHSDFFDQGFGGEKLPTKMVSGSYNIQTNEPAYPVTEYEVVYQTDTSGRVIERKQTNEYQGIEYVNTYNYSYY